MGDDTVGTVASAITIAGTLLSTVLLVLKILTWKKAIDKLPGRLSTDLKLLDLLKALINHVEEHIDNAKRPPCSQTNEILVCLRQCRAVKELASGFVENAGEQTSHPARCMKMINSCRILWGGCLVNIESQLTSHIHKLTEEMVMPDPSSIQLDKLNRQERKQFSSQLFSPVVVHDASKTRAIEHIPIVLDPSTLERHQRREVFTFRFLSRGFKLGFHRSASGNILPSLRPYVIQSVDSEIFSAVSGGDLNKTLELFSSGQSSPFVRDKTGCSLLHVSHALHNSPRIAVLNLNQRKQYASCSNNLLLCKTLIDFGLGDNVDEETPQGLTPGHLALLHAIWDRSKDRTFVNHLVSMLMQCSYSPGAYAKSPKIFLIGCCAGVPDVSKLRHFQNIAAPRVFEESKNNLLHVAKIYILASHSKRHPHPDVLKFLLGLSQADELVEALESTQGRGCLLHIVAVGLTRYHRGSRPTFAGFPTADEFDKDAKKWKNLCCALIRTSREGELYHVDNFKLDDILKGYSRTRPTEWNGSPLFSVLQALFLDDFAAPSSQHGSTCTKSKPWYHSLLLTVRIWLGQIATAGVDLKHYGLRESRLLTAQRHANIGCLDFTMWSSSWSPQHRAFIETSLPVRLVGFAYGSLVHEWILDWEIDVEKLVGEFWHAVGLETFCPQPPGSWVK